MNALKDSLPRQSLRQQVLDVVQSFPGSTTQEIVAEVNGYIGDVRWHLNKLRAAGVIHSINPFQHTSAGRPLYWYDGPLPPKGARRDPRLDRQPPPVAEPRPTDLEDAEILGAEEMERLRAENTALRSALRSGASGDWRAASVFLMDAEEAR